MVENENQVQQKNIYECKPDNKKQIREFIPHTKEKRERKREVTTEQHNNPYQRRNSIIQIKVPEPSCLAYFV
jgi:hypothetical protein